MGKVRWTEEAARWLQDIHDYIAEENPSAAQRTVRGIYNKAQELSRFPERGYRYSAAPDKHIRIILYGHYRIAYLVKSGGHIDILESSTEPRYRPVLEAVALNETNSRKAHIMGGTKSS